MNVKARIGKWADTFEQIGPEYIIGIFTDV